MGRVVEKIIYNAYRSDIRGTDYELIAEWSNTERGQYLIKHGEYIRHERIKTITEYGYEHLLFISFDIPDNLETIYYIKYGKNGSSS